MLRHNKSVMSMTFVCSGIAKLECQISLGISFLFLICPCMVCLKENMQRKIKSKKNQNVLYMIASVSLRRCGSYKMYLEDDNPPQASMIVCELKQLCNLAMFFTHNKQHSLLLLIHVQVQCDLAITRNTCVNVCPLNCLDLFLKYKIC